MLENLFNLIKENAGDPVINNPAIPNEKNNEVIADATHAVASGLQSELAGGGLQNILNMFSSGGGSGSSLFSNPIVQNIIGNFVGKLTGTHNLSDTQANGIANSLIPNVISSLIGKTNDPNNNSFDIAGIISSLSGAGNQQNGGGGFDLQGIISKVAADGLDADHDGSVGLNDIISKITAGAQQQQVQPATAGGLMDMIKGFIK